MYPMKPFLTFLTLSLVILTCEAQTRFQMGGQQVTSSAHRLYVNDQMKTRPSRFTFRTVNEALLFAQASFLSDATEGSNLLLQHRPACRNTTRNSSQSFAS